MKKILWLISWLLALNSIQAQTNSKGFAKINKVSPTTQKGIKPNRALLIFNFQGPDGKAAKSHIKVVVDSKDTVYPKIDPKTGIAKLTTTPGDHSLKFMANYWYSVKMNKVSFKDKNTYNLFIRFEAREIGMGKAGQDD